MIQAANYPINVRRGDTGTWKFTLDNLDESGNVSNPIDITDWAFTGKVKKDQNVVWFQFPITKTDPTNGKFEFYIDKTTSENLLPVGSPPPDSASYEIQASFDNNGETAVATIILGTFTVIRDLVR